MSISKKFVIALAISGIATATIALAQESETQIRPVEHRASDVEQILDSALVEKFSPGLSIAVLANGKILFSKGYGKTEVGKPNPVTADTPFYIASTTKSFTAHIAAQLAQRDAFSLTVPVSELMPELRFHPSVDAGKVTLESLLNHTHGIDGDGPVSYRTAYTGEYTDTKQLLGMLAYHPAAKTGNTFNYSNIGPVLASYILEHKTGKRWQDLIDELIFNPLQMHHSANRSSQLDHVAIAQGHEINADGFKPVKAKKQDANMHAAGGTYSSANDLAAWIGVHLNQGQWHGKSLYNPQLMAKAWSETAKQDRTRQGMKRVGWSLGWDIAEYKGQTIYLRPGGFAGYGAHISMIPERGLGIVVLTNGGKLASMMSQHIVDSVYALLLQDPDHLVRRISEEARLNAVYPKIMLSRQAEKDDRAARQQAMSLPMASYAGVFQSSFGTLICDIRENRLHLQMGQLEDIAEVFSADKHSFRTELIGRGQVLTYVFKDDKVTGIKFGGVLYTKM